MNCLRCLSFVFSLVVLMAGMALPAHAAPLILTADQDCIPLSGHMEVLRDDTGKLTIQDVVSEPLCTKFKAISGNLAAGYLNKGAIWVRFTIQRAPDSPPDWILEAGPAFNEQLQLYIPSSHGNFDIKYGGILLPFSQREIRFRLDLFRLTLPTEKPQTIHLRIASNRNIKANPVLWQPNPLRQDMVLGALGHGAYLGIILLTVCLNLLYWVRLRDSLYGYYLFYVLGITYVLFDDYGYAHQFLWTDQTSCQTGFLRIVMLLIVTFNAGFLSKMLNLRQLMPRLDYRFRAMSLGITGVGIILILTGFQHQIRVPLQCVLLLVCSTSIAISIRLIHKSPGAVYFLTAFGVLLVWVCAIVLTNLGLIQNSKPLMVLTPICTLTHILVLNVAFISRMLRVKEDKLLTESALAEERRTVEQQRQFIRLISHELRNPLSIIDSTAQILPVLREDPEKFEKKAAVIQSATHRINSLLNKYLLNDSINVDGAMLDMQATDIRQLLRNVVERAQTETDHHQISFDPDGLPSSYTCDHALVEILIGILLDNAVKYSPDGGTITLCGRIEQPGKLIVEVRDQGVGISPEHADRIFERFYRAEQVPGVTGAGLGLYLAQHIALLHGGAVSFSSMPGQGSTFSVTLETVAL